MINPPKHSYEEVRGTAVNILLAKPSGQFNERLMHDVPVALHAVAGSGGIADQHVVGGWGGAGADPEECGEGRMPRPPSIEAEYELVEVVL
jgi:hypothetical protein